MEVSVELHIIIKFTMYNTFFASAGRVGEVVVNQTNYEGCQFNVHFIQCQISTDISGIVNGFVQNMSRTISNMHTYLFNL